MTTRETNEIRELTRDDLELVAGGSLARDITGAVWLLSEVAATLLTAGCTATDFAGISPDPWA